MPERVVDLLEAVEVDQQHRRRPGLTPREHDGLLEPIVEQLPVRQPCEAVVERLVVDLAHVPVEAPRHAPQRGQQRDEQGEQPQAEDGRDGDVLFTRRRRDRRVRLVNLDAPAAAPPS